MIAPAFAGWLSAGCPWLAAGQVGLREQGYMVTNDEVQQLMSRMDMNMDGELEFGEVVTALIDWDTLHTDAAFGMAVDTVFSKLDKDKSGYLSSVELMPLLPSFLDRAGEDLREAEVRRGTLVRSLPCRRG